MQRLSGNSKYAVFERNESIKSGLAQEQDYQLSGDVPQNEIREICKRKGVDFVTVVDVLLLKDGKCHMTGRIVNVVTGEDVKAGTETRDFKGIETLQAMSNRLAYRLYVLE